ncbi:MAG TPA: OmpA family protein [Planctomycetota bacterium]|nr:OmpA family protein [Planctomycetota bacterium]
MSVRLSSILALAVAASSAIGCATVSSEKYARDIAALRDYNDTLVRRNQALEAQNEGMGRQLDDVTLARTTDELYSQLARQLQTALDSLRNGETGGMNYNAKTGAWEMGTDLLFDSGSDKISAKGTEILKKFADAHKDKAFHFRIVGHTDCAKIAKKGTKELLDTDTNMELSTIRAIAVMGALKNFGIPESSFAECVGKGNREPCAANDRNPANMKKNRRVEIYVLTVSGSMKTSSPRREAPAKKDVTTK